MLTGKYLDPETGKYFGSDSARIPEGSRHKVFPSFMPRFIKVCVYLPEPFRPSSRSPHMR